MARLVHGHGLAGPFGKCTPAPTAEFFLDVGSAASATYRLLHHAVVIHIEGPLTSRSAEMTPT
jgi:hypothetical protein